MPITRKLKRVGESDGASYTRVLQIIDINIRLKGEVFRIYISRVSEPSHLHGEFTVRRRDAPLAKRFSAARSLHVLRASTRTRLIARAR